MLCIALLFKLFNVEREWLNYGKFNFLYFLLICRILASHAEAHLNKRFKCVKHNSAVCELEVVRMYCVWLSKKFAIVCRFIICYDFFFLNLIGYLIFILLKYVTYIAMHSRVLITSMWLIDRFTHRWVFNWRNSASISYKKPV